MSEPRFNVDTVIIGGGPAGLWTLHELTAAGREAVLLESEALGSGQTVASQGIIHGGLKYTLRGTMTGAAEAIRDMPERWRQCLAGDAREGGEGGPDLSATVMRSQGCHLWRTTSLRSRLGMVGARAGLRIKPQRLERSDWPEALGHVNGEVFWLNEQVISPPSFVAALAAGVSDRLVKVDPAQLNFERNAEGAVEAVEWGTPAVLRPLHVVLTAGLGNAQLRELAGFPDAMMQRRAVHMILARGLNLPPLNGHCVDGAKTRVTLTTDTDTAGRTVWQVGGQVSEDGITMSRNDLIAHAQREVAASLGFTEMPAEWGDVQWATYQLDKAEVVTGTGGRPDDAFAVRHHNIITAWPTKLALVPRLAERVAQLLDEPLAHDSDARALITLEARPTVALPPWETEREWTGRGGARDQASANATTTGATT